MAEQDEKAFKRPLPKQFYCVLLKFEEKAQKKEITIDELVSMTYMYGEIVSYYDAFTDPIKYYFMEKLQSYLTEIIYLKKKHENERVQISLTPERRASLTKMKNYRQKKLTHMIQLQETEKQKDLKFEQIVDSYWQNVNENDQNIKQQLIQQDNALNQRIQNRKLTRNQMHNKLSTSTLSQSSLLDEDISPQKQDTQIDLHLLDQKQQQQQQQQQQIQQLQGT